MYPQSDSVELSFQRIWAADQHLAEELLQWLEGIENRKMPGRHPNPQTTALLDRWDKFGQYFFPRYLEARKVDPPPGHGDP